MSQLPNSIFLGFSKKSVLLNDEVLTKLREFWPLRWEFAKKVRQSLNLGNQIGTTEFKS